jgi:hypothetical protein
LCEDLLEASGLLLDLCVLFLELAQGLEKICDELIDEDS